MPFDLHCTSILIFLVSCNKLFAALQVDISNFMDAESLVSRGMLKRSTAATNANSESRHVFYTHSLT
jgi:hypothetical protein